VSEPGMSDTAGIVLSAITLLNLVVAIVLTRYIGVDEKRPVSNVVPCGPEDFANSNPVAWRLALELAKGSVIDALSWMQWANQSTEGNQTCPN
jgi:hypothetical protein